MAPITPIPRRPVSVRPATPEDLPFVDALQKKHTKQVGWFPTKTIEGKIKLGHVLIAEEMQNDECRMQNGEQTGNYPASSSSFCIHHSAFCISRPLGYLIASDRYFKHDDVGVIYQINVAEGSRRALVGATLLKAQFERSAYGCKLYCCWCAQDIEANRFWESMGFVPLAFRAGSREKGRVHIFWQRRIHSGDTTTPYWFPSQTTGGSIREDRLVLPIPPGTHWSGEMPRVLPRGEPPAEAPKRLPGARTRQEKREKVAQPKPSIYCISHSKLHFAPPAPAAAAKGPKDKPPREKRKAVKNDPKLVAAARELRDRWLEHVNADPSALRIDGKYDVSRRIEGREAEPERRLLAG